MTEEWQIMKKVLNTPEKIERAAGVLHFSPQTIAAWTKPPTSAKIPTINASILQRMTKLLNAVFLVNPGGGALILYYIKAHYWKLFPPAPSPIPVGTSAERIAAAIKLHERVLAASASLALTGASEESLNHFIELCDHLDDLILAIHQNLEVNNIG